MATTLIDCVIHWRKKLDKNPDEDVILNVIRKLSKIPITLDILEATHIGKCIRKLSKRDDIVGEKAKSVLNKWRDTFAKSESSKNPKLSSGSKKENVNKASKSSSKHGVPQEKNVYRQKEASSDHKSKHQKHSLSHNTSQQSSKKLNENCNLISPVESSHSLYNYEAKEAQLNYKDYDPHAEVSEGYNPECPEFFPGDSKTVKIKKPALVDTYEPSSLKRKSNEEKQVEPASKSLSKKLKTENQATSHLDNAVESKKSQEKKDKHNFQKDKSKKHNSHSSNVKKESCDKVKSESDRTVKHKSHADVKKHKNKESNEKINASKLKPKVKILTSEEFTSSNVTFEDCLGFNDIVTVKKKKSAKSQSHTSEKKPSAGTIKNKSKPSEKVNNKSPVENGKDASSRAGKEKVFSIPKPSMKLDVADITSTLPEIQPNYKPLPRSLDFYSPKKKEVLTNEDAIRFTSSRREKTAVYSGRKSYFTEVPSLFEACTRVLIENVDAIEYLGELPYFLLKPVLERCNPSQLYNIESYNPYLLEDSNELWEIHCRRDYKLLSPNEHETWRDLYLRAHDERERKLKSVTANISASMSKSNPVRQVKLAYVDTYAKPPRDVARRQAKHGTALPVNHTVKAGPPSKATPRPTAPAVNSSVSSSSSTFATTNFTPKKPKIAPLMAKTLKSMKCYRRK